MSDSENDSKYFFENKDFITDEDSETEDDMESLEEDFRGMKLAHYQYEL